MGASATWGAGATGVGITGRGGAAAATGGRGGGGGGGGAAGAAVGPVGRRFTVSTTTVFVRPCEKLCRTVSGEIAGRLSVNVFVGVTDNVSAGFFVSLIPCQILRVAPVFSPKFR